MLTPYDAREEAGAGSALQWRERGDGHWTAHALGGHYELVPKEGRYQTWWMGRSQTPVDLGNHGTLGGAMGAAKRHADLEQRMAAETAEDCAHTHPASVPSAPCPDPSAHKPTPVIAAVHKTETAIVAAESSSGIKWHEAAGGTGAKRGTHSYTAAGPWGEYHIWPPPPRRRGYHLQWANTQGQPAPHTGLWHNLGLYDSPNLAKAAAKKHAQSIGALQKKAPAPRRRKK
jgi:hypothetical protein